MFGKLTVALCTDTVHFSGYLPAAAAWLSGYPVDLNTLIDGELELDFMACCSQSMLLTLSGLYLFFRC